MEAPDTTVVAVTDLSTARARLAQRRYPGIEITSDYRDLLNNTDIDAIAISTPVSTHYPLAMDALKAGKHVLVEKPMALNSGEAARLIDVAEQRRLVLMVDHTFVYTGAVRKIRELIQNGSIGDIYYCDSTRVNLGLFRHDVDVIWDLAVHDVSIMEHILPGSPSAVSATGGTHVEGATANIAYVTAFYDSSLISHFNVNWLSPVKVRRTMVGGSRQMIVYDDIESDEKVKIYDKGVTVKNGSESLYNMMVSYRSGDMYAPKLDLTEALRTEAQHFAECITTGSKPITDGLSGLRVVSVLEAATRSMNARGREQAVVNYGAAQVAAV